MRALPAILVAASLLTCADAASAGVRQRDKYPFTSRTTTIRENLADAAVVFYARAENARWNGDDGQTDLVILELLRAHPYFKERKVVTIDKFISGLDAKKPTYFLVAADFHKNKWDYYWGIVAGERELAYLRGILKLDPAKPIAR